MRALFISLFMFLLLAGMAQNLIQGRIRDSKSKTPIAYCPVGIKNKNSGGLTNEEGVFQIKANEADTLLIKLMGYFDKQVAVKNLLSNPDIYLTEREIKLQEVVVTDKKDALVEIMEKCKIKLMNSESCKSKAYYVLKTGISTQPVELLECYYNASFDENKINSLEFKNGRVALADANGFFFVSRDISMAFTMMDLLNEGAKFPANPFQFRKNKFRKKFNLEMNTVNQNDTLVYVIKFKPKKNEDEIFSGEMWIEDLSFNVKKINLQIENSYIHPFLPAQKEFGEIKSVSMNITKTYKSEGQINRPENIYFNYKINYHHLKAKIRFREMDTSFIVEGKGLMNLYDYNQPFFTPHFRYPEYIDDYRKMSSLPYNEAFWNSCRSLVYSKETQKNILYFKHNGFLYNYNQSPVDMWSRWKYNKSKHVEGPLGFEHEYVLWSDKWRLHLKKGSLVRDTSETPQNKTASQTKYSLNIQLYLDVNKMGDTLHFCSATILDPFDTFYNLNEEPQTNCFLNIYFDLYEMARRNMLREISNHKYSVAQIDSVYKNVTEEMERLSTEYTVDTEHGKDLKAMEKWNQKVLLELNIDNFSVFGLAKRSR